MQVVDGARLVVQHGFGALLGSVRDGIAYVGDQKLVYPVGRFIAHYDTQSQSQSMVYEQPPSSSKIFALAVSPSCKYLAVSEGTTSAKGPGRVLIKVIFLPTHRLMRTVELPHDGVELTCLTFSHDSKAVAFQLAGEDEHVTAIWNWDEDTVRAAETSRCAPATQPNPPAARAARARAHARALHIAERSPGQPPACSTPRHTLTAQPPRRPAYLSFACLCCARS